MPLTSHSLFHTIEGVAALATAILALGTVLLALATFRVARKTRGVANATVGLVELTRDEVAAVREQSIAAREEVAISREALQASIRPYIVEVKPGSRPEGIAPIGIDVDRHTDGRTVFSIPVRNVGAGLARLEHGPRMLWSESGSPNGQAIYGGTVDALVLPPQEAAFLRFEFGPAERRRVVGIDAGRRFSVEIDYADISGEQAQTTRIDIERRDDAGWRFADIRLTDRGWS